MPATPPKPNEAPFADANAFVEAILRAYPPGDPDDGFTLRAISEGDPVPEMPQRGLRLLLTFPKGTTVPTYLHD